MALNSAEGKSAPPLIARSLCKNYGGSFVVKDVSFAVQAGECLGFLGPNGAGKTTTMRICLGLTRPDSGEARLFDKPLPEFALEARRRIGVVPQKDSLDPDFTAAENLRVFAGYFGISRADSAARVPELLAFAGLEKRADERIPNLSGGMQRRLTLARALINDPDLIFLDEPTTGLDPQARHLIWERLRRLLADGKTLFLTTHFMEEAERLCDRVCILDSGKIIAEGIPRALTQSHVEPEVVEIYGEKASAFLRSHSGLSLRCERFGNLSYCYCADSAPLISALKNDAPSLSFVHRPSNLEDVFLKLTGRDLRE